MYIIILMHGTQILIKPRSEVHMHIPIILIKGFDAMSLIIICSVLNLMIIHIITCIFLAPY